MKLHPDCVIQCQGYKAIDARCGEFCERLALDCEDEQWQCDYCGAWSNDTHREDCPAVFGQ